MFGKYIYRISGNFGGNLILAILARSTQPPKLSDANNSISPNKIVTDITCTGINKYLSTMTQNEERSLHNTCN